jgi:hypothetical protein
MYDILQENKLPLQVCVQKILFCCICCNILSLWGTISCAKGYIGANMQENKISTIKSTSNVRRKIIT